MSEVNELIALVAKLAESQAKLMEEHAKLISASANNLILVESSKCGSYSSGEECSDKDDRCTEVDYRDSVTGYNSDDGYGTDNHSEVICKGGDSVVSYSDYGVHEQCGKAKNKDSGSSALVAESQRRYQLLLGPEWKRYYEQCSGSGGYSSEEDVSSIHPDDDSVCDIYEQNGGSACVSEVWQKQHQLRRPWTQQQQNCQPYDSYTGEHDGGDGFSSMKDVASIHHDGDSDGAGYEQGSGTNDVNSSSSSGDCGRSQTQQRQRQQVTEGIT